jgi:hypothetical protein
MRSDAIIFTLLFAGLLGSCSSIPYSSSSSWNSAMKQRGVSNGETAKAVGIVIDAIQVDKVLGAGSIETEMRRIAEMLILEKGFYVTGDADSASFHLKLVGVEREFLQGWQNRRSVSIEAWLWDIHDTAKPPFAVGRSVTVGNGSLSSSLELERMLRKALLPVLQQILPAK